MKRKDFKNGGRFVLFCAVMILGAFLLIGCGSDGDTGPTGATGATGPPGSPAPGSDVVATSETCSVCHGSGKIADIAVAHPDPTGQEVTLSNITLMNAGGVAMVSFNAATASGPVTDLTLDDFRFMIANLVPAGTATTDWGTWDSPYFERWASEQSGTDHSGNPVPHGTFDASDAANGNYTYTFLTGFGSPEALAEAPDYNAGHIQRLVIVANGRDDADGNAITNNTVGFLDFIVPAPGTNAVPLVSQRLFVTADACKKCHSPEFVEAAHADRYLDTRTCVVCHSPLGHYGDRMQEDNAYLPLLIHQIHSAIPNPAFADQINGLGFGAVTFPQEVEKCVICHTDSGLNLGTGDMIENYKNHPTAEICSSCHIAVNFTTGDNHAGGPQTNDACTVCHPADGFGFGKSITTAHDTTPTGVNVPEFDVTLTITPPVNGLYYDTGEAPIVRVTLSNHSNGSAVAPALYTTPEDDAGVSGGGLSVAGLYVYGPRAKSVPVLATGTVTDPNFDSETGTPTQSHSMFVLGSDSRVVTDSTGFGYQLLPIPAGMTAGTYMVRVRIGDYGRVGTGNYHIESTAFTTIQIGTATVEPKVAGNACINCHGTGTAEFHDERHAVVFDTDQCLACHDQSDNHAIPIANRVHAVHSANSDGDLYFILDEGTRDWSDVTFPQNIQMTDGDPRCEACHTSGNGSYYTNPFMMPCVGCHTDNGILDHMRQNGGPF
jgi:OmcA/MtrC family decaheme c-type cytochrome